ncbi:hypothetical protein GCM10009828_003250 [Actinoplanes couchii]|uniref:Solute-binding protein family 3/N-terminal domain-containing protein n=1 Tax=Actinoplanes couchii TaxID=403638 RepID=A0ABQ3XN08_9ACTN|nr:hypothetical protein Aco03nite_082570 [Actinoplanes couchii]
MVAALAGTSACGKEEEVDPAAYLSGEVLIGINTDLPGWSEYSNGVWQGFDITLRSRRGLLGPGGPGGLRLPRHRG